MTEKHLLWWIFKAVDDHQLDLRELLDGETWEKIGAPDWAFPAIQEAYREYSSRGQKT